VVWARDGQTLFYVRLDANQRPLYVYRHRIGTATSDDVLLYEEKDHGFYVGVGQTQSGRFVIIDAHDHQTNEVYLIDADAPESAPRLVAPRQHGHEYGVEHHSDRLIITTNSGGAEDFRICEAPLAAPTPPTGGKFWRTSRDGSFSKPSPSRTTWPGSSAKTACRALSCVVSATATNTPSPSTRRPTRSACRVFMSSTPRRCALPIPP
jgi:hypothetical protein